MPAVSERDAASLLEIVHDAADDDGCEPFPSSVLAALVRLIPSDAYVGYDESDFADCYRDMGRVQIIGEPPTAALMPVFHAFGWQDPMRGCIHAREERVLRLSDFLTRRQRRKLEYDALVWRPLGIDDSLRLWLPAPKKEARSIYLERSGKSYTDREKTLLSLLRPHFVRIRANAEFRRRINGDNRLTAREAEVLGWVARGKTNREVSRLLFISPNTVRRHLENIFEKLEVHTRTGAAAYARRTLIDASNLDEDVA